MERKEDLSFGRFADLSLELDCTSFRSDKYLLAVLNTYFSCVLVGYLNIRLRTGFLQSPRSSGLRPSMKVIHVPPRGEPQRELVVRLLFGRKVMARLQNGAAGRIHREILILCVRRARFQIVTKTLTVLGGGEEMAIVEKPLFPVWMVIVARPLKSRPTRKLSVSQCAIVAWSALR